MKWCPDCNMYLETKKEDPENSTYARPHWCDWCKQYKDDNITWQPNMKIYKYLTWGLLGLVALGILKAFLL